MFVQQLKPKESLNLVVLVSLIQPVTTVSVSILHGKNTSTLMMDLTCTAQIICALMIPPCLVVLIMLVPLLLKELMLMAHTAHKTHVITMTLLKDAPTGLVMPTLETGVVMTLIMNSDIVLEIIVTVTLIPQTQNAQDSKNFLGVIKTQPDLTNKDNSAQNTFVLSQTPCSLLLGALIMSSQK
jgi:hypothetical protein